MTCNELHVTDYKFKYLQGINTRCSYTQEHTTTCIYTRTYNNLHIHKNIQQLAYAQEPTTTCICIHTGTCIYIYTKLYIRQLAYTYIRQRAYTYTQECVHEDIYSWHSTHHWLTPNIMCICTRTCVVNTDIYSWHVTHHWLTPNISLTCNGVVLYTRLYTHSRAIVVLSSFAQICAYMSYGVATISRILKIIGLFCKRALQKRLYSAKETYDFK